MQGFNDTIDTIPFWTTTAWKRKAIDGNLFWMNAQQMGFYFPYYYFLAHILTFRIWSPLLPIGITGCGKVQTRGAGSKGSLQLWIRNCVLQNGTELGLVAPVNSSCSSRSILRQIGIGWNSPTKTPCAISTVEPDEIPEVFITSFCGHVPRYH